MQFVPLCDLEMSYTDLEFVDYGAGGQYYGHLEGTLAGDRLRGLLRLVNLPPKRPDDVNMPTLRGILTTDDGATVFVAMDGLSVLRPEDNARVYAATLTFRTGDPRYTWLNTVFAVQEGVLEMPAARGRAYRCVPTIA
jgi:hypothetical protein